MHTDGTTTCLEAGGMLLGVFDASDFAEGTIALGSGDRVVCVTDGITEASRGESQFGDEMLAALLRHEDRNTNAQ